jgi:short chain dehydrogenase
LCGSLTDNGRISRSVSLKAHLPFRFTQTRDARALYGKRRRFNNAGVYNLLPLDEVTEEDFHRHFNINVLGLLLATQEAAKLFGDQGGSVINIGSVASDLNSPNTVLRGA